MLNTDRLEVTETLNLRSSSFEDEFTMMEEEELLSIGSIEDRWYALDDELRTEIIMSHRHMKAHRDVPMYMEFHGSRTLELMVEGDDHEVRYYEYFTYPKTVKIVTASPGQHLGKYQYSLAQLDRLMTRLFRYEGNLFWAKFRMGA